jgi:hypothetical protein
MGVQNCTMSDAESERQGQAFQLSNNKYSTSIWTVTSTVDSGATGLQYVITLYELRSIQRRDLPSDRPHWHTGTLVG